MGRLDPLYADEVFFMPLCCAPAIAAKGFAGNRVSDGGQPSFCADFELLGDYLSVCNYSVQ